MIVYCLLQIEQIRRDAEEIKRDFREYLTSTSDDVEKFSVETLISTTVLDDLYIYSTDLADRKPDKQLLKMFQTVSEKLKMTDEDEQYEQHLIVKRVYFQDHGKGSPSRYNSPGGLPKIHDKAQPLHEVFILFLLA